MAQYMKVMLFETAIEAIVMQVCTRNEPVTIVIMHVPGLDWFYPFVKWFFMVKDVRPWYT